jgi:hypothetical protein
MTKAGVEEQEEPVIDPGRAHLRHMNRFFRGRNRGRVPLGIDLLLTHFRDLPQPRRGRARCQPLTNLLVMALFGAIAGADRCQTLSLFVALRLGFFGRFLDIPNETPDADDFRRAFSALDPPAFAAAFGAWVTALVRELAGATDVGDGKPLRAALARADRAAPFRRIDVWTRESDLVLAHRGVPGAPSRAALETLALLDLRQATVTADAQHGSAAVARACREREAHYFPAREGHGCGFERERGYGLAVAIDEEPRAVRDLRALQNLALVGRYALALLRRDKSQRLSLTHKRQRAAWCDEYVLQVLTAGNLEV